MILARILAQLKQQHWIGAVMELVIVVAGVFIGIQASNWNQAREDAQKGRQFAGRLLRDLRRDLDGREQMIAYYREVSASAEKTVALLDGAAPDPRALVVNAYRATEMNYYTTIRATWDELVSSGEVGILPSSIDLGDISMFFNFDVSLDTKNAIERSPYRQRIRRLMPHAAQKAIRAGCSDVTDDINNVIAFKPDCTLDLSDAAIAAAAAALLHDPDLLPDLRLQFSTVEGAVNNIGGDVVMLKRAIASFDADARQLADAGDAQKK
jgi:hypothetical protein